MIELQYPGGRRFQSSWTGLGLASFLAAALLGISLFQTLTTFIIRLYESDLMLGAVGNVSVFSRVTLDVALFGLGLLILHGMLALSVFVLACLTEVAWPRLARLRRGLVVLWFALAVAVVLLLNADWFPRSHAGSYYAGFAGRSLGRLSVAELTALIVGTLAAAIAARALWRLSNRAGAGWRRIPAVSVIAVLAILLVAGSRGAVPAQATQGKTNVVILGLDSLRLAELRRFEGRGWTPNIDSFLQAADVFPDTITPLARTFPSWVAILSGRSPRSTGAVFNLVRRGDVSANPTIADLLAAEGYATVFATDEVRFANIDESYGFERVVTPPIGAADFLIAQVGDLPLSNVFANTRLGGILLGYLHANRGVAYLYQPASFIDRLRNELPVRRPLFLAVHLTAAHWPYFHADTPPELRSRIGVTDNPMYREALQTADRMFGAVIELLREKGILENAVVVVLSDHGEALGMPGDALLGGLDGRVQGLQTPIDVLASGHGQSVLSPVQYEVLLGFRGFGSQAWIGGKGREVQQPASLEDILPTVIELLGLKAPAVDGMSLVPWVLDQSGRTGGERVHRIRFTETDIRVTPGENGAFDEHDAARQAARLFEVEPASGWLHLRPGMIQQLMMMKERAAMDDRRLLAALPAAPDRHQYLLVDRRSGRGRVLQGRPDSDDAAAVRLWDALQANFAGELRPPVVVTPDGQLVFARQWTALWSSPEGAIQ